MRLVRGRVRRLCVGGDTDRYTGTGLGERGVGLGGGRELRGLDREGLDAGDRLSVRVVRGARHLRLRLGDCLGGGHHEGLRGELGLRGLRAAVRQLDHGFRDMNTGFRELGRLVHRLADGLGEVGGLVRELGSLFGGPRLGRGRRLRVLRGLEHLLGRQGLARLGNLCRGA
nr:hypothetical protein [Streptomyces sp. S1D4-11]